MAGFMEYIRSGGTGQLPEKQELIDILAKYPWFTTARMVDTGGPDKKDPLLELHFLSNARRTTIPRIDPTTLKNKVQMSGNEDIIESFLQRGEHRVVPTHDTPEYDAAHESTIFKISEEMVNEELATIYRNQGLNDLAKEIYEQLCLLYPEKSVYFAEIIGEIDSGIDKK